MVSSKRKTAEYVVVDWLSTSLAILLFNIVRYTFIPIVGGFYTLGNFLGSPMVLAGQILFPLGMLVIYYMSGYYSNVFHRSRVVEFTTTLGSAAIGTLVVIFVALINDLTNDRAQDYRVFFYAFTLLFTVVYIPRLIITTLTWRSISRGTIQFPTAIIVPGDHPELYDEFAQTRMPHMGFHTVARVFTGDKPVDKTDSGMTELMAEELPAAVKRLGIVRLIVLPHPDGWEATLNIINGLYALDLPIFVSARKLPPYLLNHRLVSFTADPLIDVSHAHLSPSTLCTKRAIDIAVSAVMLVVTSLPVAALACAVKIESRGPAFFGQKRVGRHRRLFTMYKLRSMCADAEPDGQPRLSSPGDPRITRIGRFMRKYRLDEFPQFFNVLRGDMSLVGPRPERLEFVEQLEAIERSHALLHRMRPGITSLAMVKYGYASTLEQMVERMKFDLIYLQNISLLSDLKIMLYTFSTVFTGKGI